MQLQSELPFQLGVSFPIWHNKSGERGRCMRSQIERRWRKSDKRGTLKVIKI